MNEKVERQLGTYKPLELTNEEGVTDSFNIKPLSMKDMVKLMQAVQKSGPIQNKEGLSEEELLEKFDPTMFEDFNDIIMITLKKSLPDVSEDRLELFASQHFMELMTKILDINMKFMDTDRNKTKIEEMRERVKNAKSAKAEDTGTE